MITVTCQHSQIIFEASSKRTKQHPLVAAFKNDNIENYRQAMEALDKAAKTGGYTTIEEYMQLTKDIFTGKVVEMTAKENNRRQAEYQAKKELEQFRKEQKDKRIEQNKILNTHGYRWQKEDYGTEDDWMPGSYSAGIGEYAGTRWQLWSPDGRPVSVSQAMDEIERGADIVLAEIEKQRHAEIEKQRQVEKEKELEEKRLEQAGREYETWREELTAGLFKTFIAPQGVEWKKIAHYDRNIPGTWHTTGDTWYQTQWNNQTIYQRDYGNTAAYFVPESELANLFLPRWEADCERIGSGYMALSALNSSLKYSGEDVIGAEYEHWIVQYFGVDQLVQIARKHAPIEVKFGAVYVVDEASKDYHILLAIQKSRFDHAINKTVYDTIYGYGDPQKNHFEPIEPQEA